MQISILIAVLVALLNIGEAYAIDADLNASLAPGADGKSVTLSTAVRIPSSGSNNSSPAENLNRVGPLVWSAQYVPVPSDNAVVGCDPSLQVQNPNPNAVLGPAADVGPLRYGQLKNRVTGDVVYETYYCPQPGGSSIPSYVPIPPTYSDIWSAVYSEAFTDQSIGSGAYVAPSSPGLTGLPTHIWAQFPNGQTIVRDVSFPGGYRLQASASIVEVNIISKSPKGRETKLASLKTSDQDGIDGGSYENPVAIHKFSTKGEFQISTGIVWSANDATLSGPAIGTIRVPIGSIRIEINRNYDVQELMPVLVK